MNKKLETKDEIVCPPARRYELNPEKAIQRWFSGSGASKGHVSFLRRHVPMFVREVSRIGVAFGTLCFWEMVANGQHGAPA